MRRITTMAIVLAAAGGLSAVGAVASASATSSDCHTWKYKVESTTGVRDREGNHLFTAYPGNVFTTTNPGPGYKEYVGNVYQRGDDLRGNGWIRVSALGYVDCW